MIEIRTGSDSDIKKIADVYKTLDSVGIKYTPRVLSAHRNTQAMLSEAQKLSKKFKVCIAAAGGSAHLPGMTASETIVPVIGLPVDTKECAGLDSFYSIVQMPEGIPVGCVGSGQAAVAGLVAAEIAAAGDVELRNTVRKERGLKALDQCSKPNKIAIVKAANSIDKAKYSSMTQLLADLGVNYEEVDVQSFEKNIDAIQTDCTVAVITITDIMDSNFKKSITMASKKTDIPSIILPVSDNSKPTGEILCKAMGTEPFVVTGINRYLNAALFGAQILGLHSSEVSKALSGYRKKLTAASQEKDKQLQSTGVQQFL